MLAVCHLPQRSVDLKSHSATPITSSTSRKRLFIEALGLDDETLSQPTRLRESSPLSFPPTFLCDFVIHYRGAAFHVHKLVLCQQSAYFRAYIEQLTSGQRSYECSDHPSIAHCIRLPDSCGKVEANKEDFRLFLCHLYFAGHYSCLPWRVRDDINPTAEPAPAVSFDCADGGKLFERLERLKAACSSKLLDDTTLPAVNEPVLSLCHCFDCASVPARAEVNISLMLEHSNQE